MIFSCHLSEVNRIRGLKMPLKKPRFYWQNMLHPRITARFHVVWLSKMSTIILVCDVALQLPCCRGTADERRLVEEWSKFGAQKSTTNPWWSWFYYVTHQRRPGISASAAVSKYWQIWWLLDGFKVFTSIAIEESILMSTEYRCEKLGPHILVESNLEALTASLIELDGWMITIWAATTYT